MNARTAETELTPPAALVNAPLSSLPIAVIAPSLTNPRKTKNQETFKEFVANIGKVGILQPVLVRPMPATRTDAAAKGKTHELVFGHRRLAGAIAAGLQSIPVNQRELTDLEVLEIQIIENLQREDVHPLEEAEGYERLMAQTNLATKDPYTAEEIGARIGKSRRYVYNRLKLLDLCDEARKAFYAGELDTSKAYLLARIDDKKVQQHALEEVFRNNPDISVRDAAIDIKDSYMLTLIKAPFDIKVAAYADAKNKVIAGPCGPCPKRTGNNPDLFGDIKSADMCTDVACFKAKTTAHLALEKKKAVDAGKKVLDSKQSAKVFDRWNPESPKYDSGYKTMNAPVPGAQVGLTFQKALGKELPTVVVHNPHTNKLIEVIDENAANALLVAKGLIKKPSASTGNYNPRAASDRYAETERVKRAGRIDAWRQARVKFAVGLSEVEWRLVAETAAEQAIYDWRSGLFCDFMTLYGLQIPYDTLGQEGLRQVGAMIDKLPFEQIPRLIFELQNFERIAESTGTNEAVAWFKDLFRRCDVNLDAHIKAAHKAAAKKETAAKKEAAEKAKEVKAPAAKTPTAKKPANTSAVKTTAAKKVPAFMKLCTPTPELALLVGDRPLARTEITKKIWEHIKKNALQDGINRRMINADATMQAALKCKRTISMFEMTKLIGDQLNKKPAKKAVKK